MKTTIKQDENGNVTSVSIGDGDNFHDVTLSISGGVIYMKEANNWVGLTKREAEFIRKHLGDMIERMDDED